MFHIGFFVLQLVVSSSDSPWYDQTWVLLDHTRWSSWNCRRYPRLSGGANSIPSWPFGCTQELCYQRCFFPQQAREPAPSGDFRIISKSWCKCLSSKQFGSRLLWHDWWPELFLDRSRSNTSLAFFCRLPCLWCNGTSLWAWLCASLSILEFSSGWG